MPKAVLKNGVIYLLEPFPPEWADGRELRVESAEELVQRVLASGRRFDYWESGMDLNSGGDFYDSFIQYQSQMLKVFDRMSGEYKFQVLDASRSINRVAATLRRGVAQVIDKRATVLAPEPPPAASEKPPAVAAVERTGKTANQQSQ